MKYLSFTVPGGNLDKPTSIPIDPVGGMPTKGIETVGEVIRWGVTTLFVVATLLALFFLIFGGIAWIMSGGEKTKVEAARKRITFAIIGLVVAFMAFFIINILGNLFGVKLIITNCSMAPWGAIICL